MLLLKTKIIVLVKGTSQKWLVIGSNLQFPELKLGTQL
jgi:hypothetical protein